MNLTLVRLFLLSMPVVAFGTSPGFGQAPGAPVGVTRVAMAAVPASKKDVEAFKADPKKFLSTFPIGGAQMTAMTKAIMAASPGDLDAFITLAGSASGQQRAALGTGLGQYARSIKGTNAPLADEIAKKIAGSGLGDLLAGYSVGSSDIQTFAVGPGATTATAASTGGPGGFPGSAFGGSVGARLTGSEIGSLFTPGAQTTSRTSYSGASINCVTSVSPRRTC